MISNNRFVVIVFNDDDNVFIIFFSFFDLFESRVGLKDVCIGYDNRFMLINKEKI